MNSTLYFLCRHKKSVIVRSCLLSVDMFCLSHRDVAAFMSYSVVSDNGDIPTVRVTKNGQLTSGPIPGNAVVHVTAQEEFGVNQTLVFLVKVSCKLTALVFPSDCDTTC